MNRRTRRILATCVVALPLLSAGCGDADRTSSSTAGADAASSDHASTERGGSSQTQLLTVSIDRSAQSEARPAAGRSGGAEDLPAVPFAEEGTVDWRLFEIAELMGAPLPQKKQIVAADGSRQEVDLSPQEIASEQKARLRQAVAHAGQVIAATHADRERETQFNNAVHYLCAAHVELAILGEAESARKLGEVAEAIWHEKPKSEAAVESAYRLVELARRMADLYGRQDAEWVRAQARQARLFGERFPEEESRVAVALMDAGRACELAGFTDFARDCYRRIRDRFPDSPYADGIVTAMRRVSLEGRTLAAEDFGGPTIEGGFLSIDRFRGRHVLVAFWMTDSPTFLADLPALKQIEETHQGGLEIIGVNLDQDETAVDRFVDEHDIGWRQVFDPDPENRGAYNVVARFYGITVVPVYWLIGPDGTVLQAPADIRNLPLP